MDRLIERLDDFLALGVTAGILVVVGAAGRAWVRRGQEQERTSRSVGVIASVVFAVVALIALLVAAPMQQESKSQLLGFIGILLSAAIALSSTTLLGNLLAGIVMRSTSGFRVGDFLRVEGHFGRVTERGWAHLELQTEDGDLTTLPNLYAATHPHTVVRASGTVLSVTLSLGYDVPRDKVEERLLSAANQCELESPFVHILELGDFSVTYRLGGLLRDVKQMLTRRSRLRGAVFDALHAAEIEIVSPTFMNTRAFGKDEQFMAQTRPTRRKTATSAEDVMFNKAEGASALERLRTERTRLKSEIETVEASLKSTSERDKVDQALVILRAELDALQVQIDAAARALEAADAPSDGDAPD